MLVTLSSNARYVLFLRFLRGVDLLSAGTFSVHMHLRLSTVLIAQVSHLAYRNPPPVRLAFTVADNSMVHVLTDNQKIFRNR